MTDKKEKTKNEPEVQETPALSFESVAELLKSSSEFSYSEQKPVRIKEELAKREKLKNVDLEQDIKLKKLTLKVLLWFLGIESFIIFAFAFLQATGWLGFVLEEWSFRLLVTATITQIYLMLRVAVEYLFPKK
ncbi:MAG: hypothetical protein HYT12_03615 [Candidatus Liptonbacteria bacterium]|nr:hypothetical protein [Candidatus Liptonbacteria bacterium]